METLTDPLAASIFWGPCRILNRHEPPDEDLVGERVQIKCIDHPILDRLVALMNGEPDPEEHIRHSYDRRDRWNRPVGWMGSPPESTLGR